MGPVNVVAAYEKFQYLRLVQLGGKARRARAAGLSLNIMDIPGAGSGPPLLLVHGFSGSAASQYATLVRHLQSRFRRIVAPDLPGHGFSEVPPSGLTDAHLVAGLRAAIDYVGEPSIIFASSMGGGVAVRCAAREPERVRGLILCSPAGGPLKPDDVEQLNRLFHIRSHRDALRFVDALFPRRRRLRHVYALGVAHQFKRPHLFGFLRSAAHMKLLTPGELESLRMPILLIWGRRDHILPTRQWAFFRAHLPAHAYIERPQSFGHAPFLDHPWAVSERIRRFVASLDGTDGQFAPFATQPAVAGSASGDT